nr:MAG: RNA-dependent RNA polymerase [Pseudoscorpian permutotetra-like virus]
MDASNPVKSNNLVSFSDLASEHLMNRRQDFQELRRLIAGGVRVFCSREGEDRILSVDGKVLKDLCQLNVFAESKETQIDITVPQVPGVRVCTYHTSGENQKGALVKVRRSFPGTRRSHAVCQQLMGRVENASLNIGKRVYASGTKTGFANRVNIWGSRRPPNQKRAFESLGLVLKDLFKEIFPIDSRLLTNWHGDMNAQLKDVKVNKTSSAGPPYYMSKSKVMGGCMEIVSDIIKAAEQDRLKTFLAENEELMIAECKNKVDRYLIDEISKKTRPYWSFSFPVQLFYSRLCQEFTSALKLFSPTTKSVNAYGFSWAHGGGERLFHWMKSTVEGEKKFVVYGDDCCLVRRLNGRLQVNFPDFKQMDGSISKEFASEVVDYVYQSFAKVFEKNNFWRMIALMWKDSLVGATFLVHGEKAYKNPTGLLTGCVGTTLVDSFLAGAAYFALIHHRVDLDDEDKVFKFLKDLGLEIKEGTWDWELVDEEPGYGERPFMGEFLGSSLIMVRGENRLEPIPFKREEDLVSLIGNLRMPREMKEISTNRYLFDAARGYMVTAAYNHSTVWNALCDIIDNIPAEVVCMRTQTGPIGPDGTHVGDSPELVSFVGEDFEWPSSDGFPDVDFCLSLYMTDNNKILGNWLPVMPSLEDDIKKFRRTKKDLQIVKLPNKWSSEAIQEDIEEKLDRSLSTRLPDDLTPLMKKTSPPKTYVKHKPYVAAARKEKVLGLVLDDVDEIPLLILEAIVLMERDTIKFIAAKKGFKLSKDFIFKRKVDKRAERETQNEVVIPPDILYEVSKRYKMKDPVSQVSSAVLESTGDLEWETDVITQQPITVRVTLLSNGVQLARYHSTSAKNAKRLLCEDIVNSSEFVSPLYNALKIEQQQQIEAQQHDLNTSAEDETSTTESSEKDTDEPSSVPSPPIPKPRRTVPKPKPRTSLKKEKTDSEEESPESGRN